MLQYNDFYVNFSTINGKMDAELYDFLELDYTYSLSRLIKILFAYDFDEKLDRF
jgi:hypothetical protein